MVRRSRDLLPGLLQLALAEWWHGLRGHGPAPARPRRPAWTRPRTQAGDMADMTDPGPPGSPWCSPVRRRPGYAELRRRIRAGGLLDRRPRYYAYQDHGRGGLAHRRGCSDSTRASRSPPTTRACRCWSEEDTLRLRCGRSGAHLAQRQRRAADRDHARRAQLPDRAPPVPGDAPARPAPLPVLCVAFWCRGLACCIARRVWSAPTLRYCVISTPLGSERSRSAAAPASPRLAATPEAST